MSRKCQFPQFRLRIDTSDDLADGRVEVGCLDPADDEVFSLSCILKMWAVDTTALPYVCHTFPHGSPYGS